jgi:hypothetical protein
MDWDTFKAMVEGMIRGMLDRKSKEFKRKVGTFLRNLADDIDNEIDITPTKDTNADGT